MTAPDVAAAVNGDKKPVAKWLKIVVYAVAFALLTTYFYKTIQPTEKLVVYHERWGPALSLACKGRLGSINLSKVASPEKEEIKSKIRAFINRKPTPSFDCATIPKEATVSPYTAYSNHWRFFLRFQSGLQTLVGSNWGIFGPSWKIVGIFACGFAALMALALYWVARLYTGILPAALLSAVAVHTQWNMLMITSMRDYTKAPFAILSFLAIFLIAFTVWRNFRTYFTAVAGFGVILGITIGFRQDMLSIFALCTLILIFFPPKIFTDRYDLHQPRNWPALGLAPIVFAGCFSLFTVYYFWLVPVEHGHSSHFLILGLYDRTFENAGWSPGSVRFNPTYQDYSGYTLIQAYSIALTGKPTIGAFSETYNTLGTWHFIETVLVFPFLLVGRIYAIFADMLSSGSLLGVDPRAAQGASTVLLINSLAAFGLIFWYNRRLSAFLILFFMGISAIMSLQYMQRHYFHVHLLWFVLATSINLYFLNRLLLYLAPVRGHFLSHPFFASDRAHGFEQKQSGWILSAILGAGALIFAVLWIAEHFTAAKFSRIVQQQPVIPATFDQTRIDGKTVFKLAQDSNWLDFRGKPLDPEFAFSQNFKNAVGGYLEVEFKTSEACKMQELDMKVEYDLDNVGYDTVRIMKIELDSAAETSRYLPVFFMKKAKFIGFSVDPEAAVCVSNFNWVGGFENIRLPIEFSAKQ